MLTTKQVRELGLKDGKDFIYLGNVRYEQGDTFFRGKKEVAVKTIIDSHHFISGDGSSWHTGMFYDFDCFHGKNMIPLEYKDRSFNHAEQRLRARQVYNPDIKVLHGNKSIEDLGSCAIRYLRDDCKFAIELGGEEVSKNPDLSVALTEAFGDKAIEIMYALQDWGDSGEMPQELLLDDNCKKVKFARIDNTEVCSGRFAGNPSTKITLLKKHCEPSHHYILVQNMRLQEDGTYSGQEIYEAEDFNEAADTYYIYTTKTVEQSLNCMEM